MNYQIFVDQTLYNVFGTSASTPVWASIITAVNDARIAAAREAASPAGERDPYRVASSEE